MTSRNRLLSLLGALFYLGLAGIEIDFISSLNVLNAEGRMVFGAFLGTAILSAGATSFLFAKPASTAAGLHKGSKKVRIALAAVSLLLFLYIAIAYPGYHAYAKRVKESQMNPPSSSQTLPPN